MNQSCRVCGEVAAGYHFGAFTCEGCKSFFGRTYNNRSSIGECKNNDQCIINKKNRTSCKSCRLKKCVSVGMSKSSSRYGRRSNWFKIHCLLQDQGMMQQQQQQPSQQPQQTQSQLDHEPDSEQLHQQLQQLQQQQQQQQSHHHHYLPDLPPSATQTPQQLNTPTQASNLQDLHQLHLAHFLQAGQGQQAAVQSLGDAVAMALALQARNQATATTTTTTTSSTANQSPTDLSLQQQHQHQPPVAPLPSQPMPRLDSSYESAMAQMRNIYMCLLVSQLSQQQASAAKGGT